MKNIEKMMASYTLLLPQLRASEVIIALIKL